MFKITDAAAKQILDASKQSDAEGLALRVAAKALSDGHIEYGMGFDEPQESDVRIEHAGATVIIDPPSNDLLDEASMDFVEIEPGVERFIFLNPLDPHYIPPKKKKPAEK